MIKNENIDHKILAEHHKKDKEGFRQLKKKYEKGLHSLWITWVKAYNFDKGIKNGTENKHKR